MQQSSEGAAGHTGPTLGVTGDSDHRPVEQGHSRSWQDAVEPSFTPLERQGVWWSCDHHYKHIYIPVSVALHSFFLFCLSFPQSSSSLPGCVSACAYSPPSHYGMYRGPVANYLSTGHHRQPPASSLAPTLPPSLAHPGSALESAGFHTATSFRLSQPEGENDSNTIDFVHVGKWCRYFISTLIQTW